MILLDGHSLTPKRKVPAEAMSLQLRERDSTASITPADMSGIGTESWFQDDTKPGKGIVWRVKSLQTAYATNTPTVQLEHIINTLRDRIMFGQHKAAQITGNKDATKCTAEQAVRYILSFQSDWKLGTFGYSVSNPYKFDGDTLLDALEKVSNSLADPWWSFDTTKYPFILNIAPRQSGTVCKLLPGRNLTTITRSIDKSGMYTRFYPIGKDDLHISGDYVSKNEKTYGISCKVETDQSLETDAELRAWATSELNRHCEPTVTITADALELAEATGESMDRMTLGRICTIPLTEYDTTISERITELNYPDKEHQPEVVRVTMCNRRNDVARVIAEAIKQGGGGRRSATRQAKEDHAWFEDTNEHVAMCARGIVGVDADGNANWERLSRLEVNEDGIFGEVKSVKEGVVDAVSRIEQTERSISATVEAIGEDGEISAASICLAIEKEGSKATISADHIILKGKTKINDVLTVIGTAAGFRKPVICESNLTINSKGTLNCYTIKLQGSNPITLKSTDLQKAVKEAKVENNQLKMKLFNGDELTFSKATDLTGAWASGVFTATASPQGKTLTTSLAPAPGQATWEGGVVSIPIYATIGNSGVMHDTGKAATATIPPQSWSYGNLHEQDTQPAGAWAAFTLDTRYQYHYVYVTVDGTSRMILLRT